MQTLPYSVSSFSPLNDWFRNQKSAPDGYSRLQQFLTPVSVDTRWESTQIPEIRYRPLSVVEEQRWKHLERKAKQENLSGYDAIEYDALLEIKLYHHLRTQEEHLSHEEVLDILRQSL